MKRFARSLGMGLLIICQSCSTTALWETTSPDERIWIESKKITPEKLEQRCAKQQVDVVPAPGGYLVGKSKGHQTADYALRAVGIPVTLAIDAVAGVVIAGSFLFVCAPELWLELLENACNQ